MCKGAKAISLYAGCLCILATLLCSTRAYAFSIEEWEPNTKVLLGGDKATPADLPPECSAYDQAQLIELFKVAENRALGAIDIQAPRDAIKYFSLMAIVGSCLDAPYLMDEPLYYIGNLKYRLHEYPEAIEYFNRALSISTTLNNYELMAKIYNDEGMAYKGLARYLEALSCYANALSISTQLGDASGEGAALSNIGCLFIQVGKNKIALKYLEKAIIKLREADDKACLASALINLGAVYKKESQFEKAWGAYKEAYELKRGLNDVDGAVLVLNNIGGINAALGRFTEAEKNYEQALKLIYTSNSPKYLGLALDNLGSTFYALGYYTNAIDYHTRARKQLEKDRDYSSLAKILNNLGLDYLATGVYSKALACFQESIEAKKKTFDREGYWITLGNIGLVYNALGDFENAKTYYMNAKEKAENWGFGNKLGNLLNNIANTYKSLGQFKEAESYYNEACKRQEADRDFLGLGTTYINMGTYLEGAGNYPGAIAYYTKAIDIFTNFSECNRAATCLNNIARLSEATGNDETALDYFNKALDVNKKACDLLGEATVLGNLGRFYRKKGDLTSAVGYFTRAFDIYHDLASGLRPESGLQVGLRSEQRSYAQDLIDILFQLKRYDEALVICEKNKAQTLSQWISKAVGSSEGLPEAELLSQLKTVYADMLQNERAKARAEAHRELGEEYEKEIAEYEKKSSELETEKTRLESELTANYPLLGNVLGRSTLTPDAIYSKLNEWNEYVINILYGTDYITVISAGPAGLVTTYTIPLADLGFRSNNENPSALLDAKSWFESEIKVIRGSSTGKAEVSQKKWYEVILKPVLSLIPKEANLLICPDGPLFELPFEALRDPDTGRFLIQDHRVRYAPSVSLAELFAHEGSSSGEPLIVGISDFNVYADPEAPVKAQIMNEELRGGSSGDEFQLKPLPNAVEEAESVNHEIGGMLLKAEGANEEAVKAEMAGAKLLHFATHGFVFPDMPELSSVVLLPGGDEDGFLTLGEVVTLDLSNCETVFLSACGTAQGKLTPGIGIFGLAEGFLVAGSKGVIGSLWSIEDKSALKVGEYYYKYRLEGELPADALRHAKLDFIEKNNANPEYWAALVLYGGMLESGDNNLPM